EHRSGHDVDATMAVYTQSLRFLRRTAGGRGDFSIRDFITDTVTRMEKPDAQAITEIRARFEGELAQLRTARNHLVAGELRQAFRMVARIAIAYPLLPDDIEPPEPDDDFAAWWAARRAAIEAHWRAQDATMPDALAALEQTHNDAAERLKKRGAPWLFIGSTQRQMHAVRPLLSLWLDAVADTILSLPDNRGRRIWLMLDELQALQMLPSLQPLLTEGAKYGVCVCAGVQNMGQIRQSYGRDGAEVILSLFNTKTFFRLQEPDTAKWAENAIGAAVKEHVHESIRLATSATMDGASMSISRTTEPIVMAGEIMRLNDLHCYLMLPGDWPVGKIALTFDPRRDTPKAIAPALVPQEPKETIYNALDALGWTPLPTGTDGDDPGVVARSVAGGQGDGGTPAPDPRPNPPRDTPPTPTKDDAKSAAKPPQDDAGARARPSAPRPQGAPSAPMKPTRPKAPDPAQPELPHTAPTDKTRASNSDAERPPTDAPRSSSPLDPAPTTAPPSMPRPPLSDLAREAIPTRKKPDRPDAEPSSAAAP
ncbi:type IV secretion system DNA-binding domain-containing protein, partial [Rubrimonas sp.]|uniref:type IV secretion system DNA-binding domain-containing protein n=1 Tax=Rubrimonas sp. TaxID=2036015 RepID=UPI002FDD8B2B